jgi:drug/metabolite transporter (DMT)-like permease
VGLVVAFLIAVGAGEPLPGSESLVWSTAAGIAGVIGLGGFYYALSRGTMGVAAPLSAVIGAGLPVIVGLTYGETIDPGRALGIGMALTAVVLISLPAGDRTTDERRLTRVDFHQFPYIIVAGVGFGLFFVFLDRATSAAETWWPLVVVRVLGLVITVGALLYAVARTRERTWRRRTDVVLGLPKLRARALAPGYLGLLFVVTGAGDLGGNAFFVLAARTDALSVAVVLSSLYPVVTTILAATFLHERLRPIQIAGVILASLSVPLLR